MKNMRESKGNYVAKRKNEERSVLRTESFCPESRDRLQWTVRWAFFWRLAIKELANGVVLFQEKPENVRVREFQAEMTRNFGFSDGFLQQTQSFVDHSEK